jgi:tetratricopeptide (TPR) repeat protein
LFEEAGKLKKAYEPLKKAVQFRPDWGTAQYTLALVELKLGKRGEAFDRFETLKTIDPTLAEKIRAALASSFVVNAN